MTGVLILLQAFQLSSPFPHVPKLLRYSRKWGAGQFGEVVLKLLQRFGRPGYPGNRSQLYWRVCVQETGQWPEKHPVLRGSLISTCFLNMQNQYVYPNTAAW